MFALALVVWKGEELGILLSWVSGEKKWEKNMGRQNKDLPQISQLSNLTGQLRKERRAIRNRESLEQNYKTSRKYAVLAWSAPASHTRYKGGKPARSCLWWNKVAEDSSLATRWCIRRFLTVLEPLVFKWAVQTALHLTFPHWVSGFAAVTLILPHVLSCNTLSLTIHVQIKYEKVTPIFTLHFSA